MKWLSKEHTDKCEEMLRLMSDRSEPDRDRRILKLGKELALVKKPKSK